jgi:hypothetical protein
MEPYLGWMWGLITVIGVAILALAMWYGTRKDRPGTRWRAPTDPAHAGSKPESPDSAHFNRDVDPSAPPRTTIPPRL